MVTPVRLRRQADDDINEAVRWYLSSADPPTATRFVDAVEMGLRQISRNPHLGSHHFAIELGIPDLRVWPLPTFPHLVFYVVTSDGVDVWRLLHPRRGLLSGRSEGPDVSG